MCLLPFVFFATVPLYGNPKELVYAWYAAREIEWHMWQHDGLKHIRRICKKLNCGKKVTTQDVESMFPAGCCIGDIKIKSGSLFEPMKEEQTLSTSGENSVPVKKTDCVLIQFRYYDIPFTLCLKKSGTVALCWECQTASRHYYLTVNKKVPDEKQLMKYAYKHYDVFAKHLYALLLSKSCPDAMRQSNPFTVQMQDAFEQSGYAFNQTVEPVPCFLINAENTYAFIRRWCRQQCRKGRTVPAMTADLQPVYKLLVKGSDALCNCVGEFFQSTVIKGVQKNGLNRWSVRHPEPRKGGKFLVKDGLLVKEEVDKSVFIIKAEYLLLPFVVKFEKMRGFYDTYERRHYGYDRMVVKPGADK